jgi:hypothetical protein
MAPRLMIVALVAGSLGAFGATTSRASGSSAPLAHATATGTAAQAKAASDYYVTFAARDCPSYLDVYANKSRNNIVESLADLGPDTQYSGGASGALVSPQYEDIAPQSNCKPLVGWRFTLGTGYQTRAVDGAWGSLSRVTGAYSDSIVTAASTPLLDASGNAVPGSSLSGATTLKLSAAQVALALKSSKLWLQGGTPYDPVMADRFGTPDSPQYGFAALRCATDANNNDNVEYLYFPTGVTHLFCYAFYVSPPPTSGTIIIKKVVTGAPAGSNPSFSFNGPLSFDPNGFTLAHGQSATFYRAGGRTWDVTEASTPDYKLKSIDCISRSGASSYTTSDTKMSVALAATDTVTCTFTNAWVPPTGKLRISKITLGGIGHFNFDVMLGSGSATTVTAISSRQGVPVDAAPSLDALEPGRYTITENEPTTNAGTWTLSDVGCNASFTRSEDSIKLTVARGDNIACTFTNRFRPSAKLSVGDITLNGTASTSYLITPERTTHPTADGDTHIHAARTTQPGVEAPASPVTAADSTDALDLGSYRIIQSVPPAPGGGAWILVSVECNGDDIPFSQGSVVVTLTAATRSIHCVFTNQYLNVRPRDPEISLPPVRPPTSPPQPPIEPEVTPPVTNPAGVDKPDKADPATPGSPWADVSVAKDVIGTGGVNLGSALSYRIVVTNHGPDTAEQVALDEQPLRSARLISVGTTAGNCTRSLPLICSLGDLRSGAKGTVTVKLVPRSSGRFLNLATVGTTTADPDLDNNVAGATAYIAAPPPPAPPFVGPGS